MRCCCFTTATTTLVLVVLSALCCPLARATVVCSSLNGPFCSSAGGSAFSLPVAPPHAASNLDEDKVTFEQHEIAKRINIERVLKQYELEAARGTGSDRFDHKDLLDTLDLLLDEAAALFSDSDDDLADESPVIGSFAFSNEDGMFEELDRMDGADLKEFFELALEEVMQSHASTLDAMSPEISQGLHTSVQQLKALKDFATFHFQVLDESRKAQIRRKFTHHRLIEVQQTFEKIVIARNARERQYALEASVFLFQLAQEAAASSQDAAQKAPSDATPSSDATGS